MTLIQNNSRTFKFNTLADLRAMPGQGLEEGDVAIFTGTQSSDGTERTYLWNTTSTDTDNSDSTIKLTDTTTGRFKAIPPVRRLSVDDYGADPSGATSSVAAFQAMNTDKGYMHMADGTYLIDAEIVNLMDSGTTLSGNGYDSVIKRATGYDDKILRCKLADFVLEADDITFTNSDNSINSAASAFVVDDITVGDPIVVWNSTGPRENNGEWTVVSVTTAKIVLSGVTLTDFAVPSNPAWATTTAYTVGNRVSEAGSNYICDVAHTSGTFATDLSNGLWILDTTVTYIQQNTCENITLRDFRYDGNASNFGASSNNRIFMQAPQGVKNLVTENLYFHDYADKPFNGSNMWMWWRMNNCNFQNSKYHGVTSCRPKLSTFTNIVMNDINDGGLDLINPDGCIIDGVVTQANGVVESGNDGIYLNFGRDVVISNVNAKGTGNGIAVSRGDGKGYQADNIRISDSVCTGQTSGRGVYMTSKHVNCVVDNVKADTRIELSTGSNNVVRNCDALGDIVLASQDDMTVEGGSCTNISFDSGSHDCTDLVLRNLVMNATGQTNGFVNTNSNGGTLANMRIEGGRILGTPTNGLNLGTTTLVEAIDLENTGTAPITVTGTVTTMYVKDRTPRIVAPTSTDSMEFGDDAMIAPSGTFTFTLKAATAVKAGTAILCKNAGAGVVTINGGGTNIDGAATLALSTQYDFAKIESDGALWNIVATNF